MAILSKKKGKQTPSDESGAPVTEKITASTRVEYQKFRLEDNGYNRAKIDTFVDHRDGKTYPEKDRDGRLTVYLEKKLRDRVILSHKDAAIMNSQSVNSKIIYLLSDKEEQFDDPLDPNNCMFNIVNHIGQ